VSAAQRLIGGFAALALGTLANQVLGFAMLAVVARRLGPENLGSFAFALNLVAYFAIPANFGVTALAVRDVAQAPERTREIAGEVIAIQGLLVALPYALLVVLAPAVAVDELSETVLPIVGLTFVLDAAALHWILYGRQRFAAIAAARTLGAVLTFVLAVALVDGGRSGTLALGWITAGGAAVTAAATLYAALRVSGQPRFGAGRRRLVRRMAASVPLGVSAVMISIYYSIDSVMLGYLKGAPDVGQYAVAYKLPLAVIGIAALWASVFFPHASELAVSSREALRAQLARIGSAAMVAAVPIAVGAVAVGGELMPELFGSQYEPAGTPFLVLVLAAAIVCVTISYGTAAIAIGDELWYAVAVTTGAVVNVILNVALIPPFGMTGAATSTVAAEVVVFGVVAWRLRRLLGPLGLEAGRLRGVAAASAIMALVIVLLPDSWPAVVQVAAGAAVYAVAAIPARAVRPGELTAAWRLVAGAAAP
jgi:O-antigen/teichoic acid export membrane protein